MLGISYKSSSNILVVCGIFHGHITGTVEIVKELVNLGHNVTCLVLENFKDRIDNTGAKIISFSIDTSNFDKMIPPTAPPIAKQSVFVAKAYEHILEILLNEKINYDYFIFDSLFDVKEMNRVLNIDSDKIILICTLNIFTDSDPSILSEKRSMALRPVNKKYNINLKDVLTAHYTPNQYKKLILNSKSFHLRSENADDKCLFIGPSIEERKIDQNFNFNKDMSKKLIYISFGTICDCKEVLIICMENFRDSEEYQVVMSVGPNIDINVFKDVPKNISIFKYVPQIQLLREVDIFITHGGLNSVGEALFNDVPLIVIPIVNDQFDNARKVKELGAGIFLDKNEITVNKNIIKEAVNDIKMNRSKYIMRVKSIVKSFMETRSNRINIYNSLFV